MKRLGDDGSAEASTGAFDLLPVTMRKDSSEEILRCRPVEWTSNDVGMPERAVKWVATCPFCSQLVEVTDVAACACGAVGRIGDGTSEPAQAPLAAQARTGFIDPIAAGLMRVDGAVRVDVA